MQIDNNSSVPIYEQIYKQLLEYITTGLMQADDKLPSVRELSSSIHIKRARFYLFLAGEGKFC